ncbi:hypothetical protein BCR44DRAFT_35026, partial [Catenaria anguillulae PL171]
MNEIQSNELLTVERSSSWDPLGFDQQYLAQSKLVSHLQIPQILLSVILNGLVLACAAKNPGNLLSSAANVLMMFVFVNNSVFAAYLFYVRLSLLLDFRWEKWFCLTFAATCTFFVAHGALCLTAICVERYLALVRFIRLKRHHAVWWYMTSIVTSAILTLVHFMPDGSAIISRAGVFCFPTKLIGWQGAVDASAMLVHSVAILAGYLLIYVQLRKVSRQATSAMKFPSMGNTTMGQLGHSPGGHHHHSFDERGFGKGKTPSDHGHAGTRVSSLIIASASVSKVGVSSVTESTHSGHSAVAHHLGNSTTTPPPQLQTSSTIKRMRRMLKSGPSNWSIASTASSILSPNHPEGRVVLRGLLSLAVYSCFVASYFYLALHALLFKERQSVQMDWFLVSTKFVSDIGDAVILFYLDRHYRETLTSLLGIKS